MSKYNREFEETAGNDIYEEDVETQQHSHRDEKFQSIDIRNTSGIEIEFKDFGGDNDSNRDAVNFQDVSLSGRQ